MKLLSFIFFLLSYTHVSCQTFSDIGELFKQKKYTELIEAGKIYLKTDSTDARIYDIIGRSYNFILQYNAAIPYLEKAIDLDQGATYVTGWAYGNLGKAYIETGDTAKGIGVLHKAVQLHGTQNATNFALHILKTIGENAESNLNTPPRWVIVEGKHIKYFFEDTTKLSGLLQHFIKRHEEAFDTLNTIFQANLPVKISFYVWLNKDLAQKILNQPLGFSNPAEYVINTHIGQTTGHEMTHVLSYWAWGLLPVNRTRFVNEGLAVAFDLGNDSKLERARISIAGKNFHSVMDIWQQEKSVDEGILYPVGGAFMQYLFEHCSLDNFKKFVKNQSISSAKNIYGKKNFEKLIQDFNTLVGF